MTEIGFEYIGLKAYAGHFINGKKLLESSSGGAASYLSEKFIDTGGIVFGVGYSEDFKSAEYYCIETPDGLERLKGSKYISSIKKIKISGQYQSVFEVISTYLLREKKILFIGLGCDIEALKCYCRKNSIKDLSLFTLELICAGTTLNIAHSTFIQEVEKNFKAKVKWLNVRYKKEGWIIPYLRIEFDDGNIFETPFNESDLGIAFNILNKQACLRCSYKGERHVGDIVIGDYFRINHDDVAYDKNGVSILIVKNKKGRDLINDIESDDFFLEEVDIKRALIDNHRYYECPKEIIDQRKLLVDLKVKGLRYAIEQHYRYLIPKTMKYSTKKRVVMWGTGTFFNRYCSLVKSLCTVINVCDNDKEKWGRVYENSILCIAPQELSLLKNIFVVIMIENEQIRNDIERQLEDLNIYDFDYILNWLRYASKDLFY